MLHYHWSLYETILYHNPYNVPALMMLIPRKWEIVKSKHKSNILTGKMSLLFICPISMLPVLSGVSKTGYKIQLSRSTIVQLSPILKLSLEIMKIACLECGMPLPLPCRPTKANYELYFSAFSDCLEHEVATFTEENNPLEDNNMVPNIEPHKYSLVLDAISASDISSDTFPSVIDEIKEEYHQVKHSFSWLQDFQTSSNANHRGHEFAAKKDQLTKISLCYKTLHEYLWYLECGSTDDLIKANLEYRRDWIPQFTGLTLSKPSSKTNVCGWISDNQVDNLSQYLSSEDNINDLKDEPSDAVPHDDMHIVDV
jgi:hypothetical protein